MTRTFVASVLAVWAFASAELAVVAFLYRAAITTAWELAVGTSLLLPTLLLLCLPAAALGGTVSGLLRGAARGPLAGVVGVACGLAAYLVATGRHFAADASRTGFAGIVAALSGLVAYALAPRLSRAFSGSPGAFAAASLALAVAAEVANRFVLVRLYPAFHQSLAVLALTLAAVAAVAVVPKGNTLFRAAVPVVLGIALAATFAKAGAVGLAGFDNLRLLLVDEAPVAGEAVRVAALVAPPPPLDLPNDCALSPSNCAPTAAAEGPSFAGRDIVLVSIDALRADHVGAYGYLRPTTPHLDALARGAAVFDHAYCATPHTSYSVTSLMTGKYMRPLLLEGVGEDSDTLATYLRHYGYRTAAFYPPAVFFIDQARFGAFERTAFGFEYAKVEFMEGQGRVAQIESYLGALPAEHRLFLWLHLFGPHEPYEAHAEHPFGDRDVDRYDSEIAAADDTVGALVALVRGKRPNAVFIVTADHGEEFGEHGGRYHGSSVYEEQVRVPLVVSAPGVIAPHRVATVVQTIDVLPTILGALSIPKGPRIRGTSFGKSLAGAADGPGFAFAETEETALLAEEGARLVCARKIGACRLYDVAHDPGERDDVSSADPARFSALRAELAALSASHGRFELLGARAESGRGYPAPIRRAMAGDADAAPELATLLDDADADIRRKAAELLFVLHRPDTRAAVRLALSRDEDPTVRRFSALALTRLGETAPLVVEMFHGTDLRFQRYAALALAETGDARGAAVLIDWWQHGGADDYERAVELLGAFAKIRDEDAVWPLVRSLGNVRLRPRIAETLAAIGDDTARGPLVAALLDERYQTARVAISNALVALGAKEELARPLIRFLGVPDPIPNGVGAALHAKILEFVGGPDRKNLARLVAQSNIGAVVDLVVPKTGNGTGVRVIVRARAAGRAGEIRVGRRAEPLPFNAKGEQLNAHKAPTIHGTDYAKLIVQPGPDAVEVSAILPAFVGAVPGRAIELVLFAESHVAVEGLAVVPLSDELPPPPPEPWKKPPETADAH